MNHILINTMYALQQKLRKRITNNRPYHSAELRDSLCGLPLCITVVSLLIIDAGQIDPCTAKQVFHKALEWGQKKHCSG
jgi:hypothetical protein